MLNVKSTPPLHNLKYLLVIPFTYWLVAFYLTPNTFFSPVHHDDYSTLGSAYGGFHWLRMRSVSSNIIYIMGELGTNFSFVLINLLTAVISALVFYFTSRLLKVELGWLAVTAFSTMVFFHPAVLWSGRYLGLITSLTSHFFGCLSLIGLLCARQKPELLVNVLAIISYGLSVFAKEDFLLPPLLLLIYFGADIYYPSTNSALKAPMVHKALERRWWVKTAFAFIFLAGASVLFSLTVVRNPHLAGVVSQVADTASYAVSIKPNVLIPTLQKLTIKYCSWQTIAASFMFIMLWIFCGEKRRELVLLAAIIFSLIIPYAVLPNNIPLHRVYAWLPWLSALFVLGSQLFWCGKLMAFSVRSTTKYFGFILFLVAFLIGYLDRAKELQAARWYESVQKSNKQMLDSILANKVLLNNEDVVGIVGVEGLSPWRKNNGDYLRKKLGFENRWIIFDSKHTDVFNVSNPAKPTYLSIYSYQRLCERPGLLVMKFDSSGVGKPLRAGELCSTLKITN